MIKVSSGMGFLYIHYLIIEIKNEFTKCMFAIFNIARGKVFLYRLKMSSGEARMFEFFTYTKKPNGAAGFEPANDRIKICWLTACRRPNNFNNSTEFFLLRQL